MAQAVRPRCAVAVCSRPATWAVLFRHHTRPMLYCEWHAVNQHGKPRWHALAITNMERVRI